MATNSGIEVTALRPAAQAGDFYVRPDQTTSGIEEGLARLAGTMAKKEKAEAKITAENIHISDSLNNATDLHNFDAYAHESPAVIAHLKELRGKAYANQWRTETEDKYNKWRMNSDESGIDFAAFMAERKTELADVLQGDRFMTSGALGSISEADHNLRAAHRSFLDNRTRVEVKEKIASTMDGYIASMTRGGLRIEDVVRQADDLVKEAHDIGSLHATDGNKLVFDHAIAMFKANGVDGYNYYLLAKQLRYAKGANGTVNSKAALEIEAAMDFVERKQAQIDADATRLKIQTDKDELQAAWNTLYEFKTDNPNQPVPQAITDALTTRGVAQTTINAQSNASDASGDLAYGQRHQRRKNAILLDMAANTHNNKGTGYTYNSLFQMVERGELHLDDIPALVTAMKAAENATPLLHGVVVRGIKGNMLDRLKNSFNYKSTANAARVSDLEKDFDIAFTGYVTQHYNRKGAQTPSEDELTDYANQAKNDIQEDAAILKQRNQAHDVYIASLVSAATKSEESRGLDIWNNADLNDVDLVLASARGQTILQQLREDPQMIVQYKPRNSQDVLELPVWKVLDLIVKKSGAFHVWYVANKAHFDRSQ